MRLPSGLLAAIANPSGGQVVLVTGAGCSFDAPTSLPLAGKCSVDAHRKLVDNGILDAGDCSEPWDLSALADLVKEKNGGKQAELVQCLPYNKFKTAKANDGHLIAAALLLEGAVSNIVTLNYDLAFSNAIATLGVEDEVSIVNGPGQHGQIGHSNVIYLHRSVENDFEEWILTKEALDNDWKESWEEVIARSMTTVPFTVFAGMGSSCGVLRHSTERLRVAVGDDARLILANPGDLSSSTFAKEIGIEEESYVQLTWIQFMRELGARFHKEIVSRLREIIAEVARREEYVDQNGGILENLSPLTEGVQALEILGFGLFRAAILLDRREFPKIEEAHLYSIAGLLLAVGCIERTGCVTASLSADGHALFRNDDNREVSVFLVDGSTKNLRWLTLENQILEHENVNARHGKKKSRKVLAIGMGGTSPSEVSPPESIVGDREGDSIIAGNESFSYWDVEELRVLPESVARLLS